ncbi:MAG: cupin domain-containing protein [Candidimonas sp.]|jgi:gentisate 1,2-dioxygenase
MSTLKMRDIPVQCNANCTTDAQKSARYYNSGTAFMKQLSQVPPSTFVTEAEQALDPEAPTGIICCDNAGILELTTPATTPNILARYIVIRPGEHLDFQAQASTLIFYCLTGAGHVGKDGTVIEWSKGDVFLMPGGETMRLRSSGDGNTVLWAVGDDPLIHVMDVTAKPSGLSSIVPVHYPADDIKRQLDLIYTAEQEADTAGRALIFSNENYDANRNIAPVLTLALNTLDPGTETRPHRHNSVAVMLVLAGENCHSAAGDVVKEWTPFSTTITPPFAWHTHHNNGDVRAELLIVQDGGIFTHSRVSGFSFEE